MTGRAIFIQGDLVLQKIQTLQRISDKELPRVFRTPSLIIGENDALSLIIYKIIIIICNNTPVIPAEKINLVDARVKCSFTPRSSKLVTSSHNAETKLTKRNLKSRFKKFKYEITYEVLWNKRRMVRVAREHMHLSYRNYLSEGRRIAKIIQASWNIAAGSR